VQLGGLEPKDLQHPFSKSFFAGNLASKSHIELLWFDLVAVQIP
jgi:hypothetical protein